MLIVNLIVFIPPLLPSLLDFIGLELSTLNILGCLSLDEHSLNFMVGRLPGDRCMLWPLSATTDPMNCHALSPNLLVSKKN